MSKESILKMNAKIRNMSDEELEFVWESLRECKANEQYDEGISMGVWAEHVYSEITFRKDRVAVLERSFNETKVMFEKRIQVLEKRIIQLSRELSKKAI